MDKVILLTDRPEECESLISYIKILFPGCEIQVQPKQAASLQSTPVTQNLSKLKNDIRKQ